MKKDEVKKKEKKKASIFGPVRLKKSHGCGKKIRLDRSKTRDRETERGQKDRGHGERGKEMEKQGRGWAYLDLVEKRGKSLDGGGDGRRPAGRRWRQQ